MKKIGIDPDNKFIGCALLEDNKLSINKFTIPEFFCEVIPSWNEEYKKLCEEHRFGDLKIYLEGGWLNSRYYHSTENVMIVNNIARKIGMNHQVGIMIEQILTYYGIKFETVKPVQNSRFKTANQKITHLQLKKFLDEYGIEFSEERSNQDERDSALLLLYYLFEYKPKKEEYTFF